MTKTLTHGNVTAFGFVDMLLPQILQSCHDIGCLPLRCPWAWSEIEITHRMFNAKIRQDKTGCDNVRGLV